jgi:hypothetical protein
MLLLSGAIRLEKQLQQMWSATFGELVMSDTQLFDA